MSVSCAPAASRSSAASPDAAAGAPELAQRLAQLQQSHDELQAFSSAVAHELRTPLHAMQSFCSLLQETLTELPAQPARHSCELYADRLQLGLAHMGDLVEGLLRLSRASSAPLRAEPVDLSALALELIDGLVARHPTQAHQCTVQPGLQARGDRLLLRQLLENLLGNAWKFSAAQGGVVRIEFGREPGPQGAFFVRDQGPGFDLAQTQAQRLFQPFERLPEARDVPGTGVGLATVRRIVTRHGGRVHAASSPGAGATFFFTLGDAA